MKIKICYTRSNNDCDCSQKAHLTQSELANKVGTKQSVISRIESGNSHFIPSLETLVRIAGALHMKLKLQLQA